MRDRILIYNKNFARRYGESMRMCGHRAEGIWWLGNTYSNHSDYYGSFPGNWLKRVLTLFPDSNGTLHLFAGSIPPGPYYRYDRKAITDEDVIVGEAEQLEETWRKTQGDRNLDLIIADPPYTEEDANKYGTIMCNRQTVISQAMKILKIGGHLVWLDQVWPMFSNADMRLVGSIFLVISTNHRVRGTFIWEKVR